MFYTKEPFVFFVCSHSSNTLDSSSFLIEVFSHVLVFGFSLCSAGWQLFYAAIWVVGFLPAPSYVLDKVRQVFMEMWKMPQSGQNSKQAKVVSVKLMAPVPSIAERYPAGWLLLLLCCYFSKIWCLYLAFCFFPFILPLAWTHISHLLNLHCPVLCSFICVAWNKATSLMENVKNECHSECLQRMFLWILPFQTNVLYLRF